MMNKSDLDFWKSRVSKLEKECAKKQKKIEQLEEVRIANNTLALFDFVGYTKKKFLK